MGSTIMANRRILLFSVMLHISLSVSILALTATRTLTSTAESAPAPSAAAAPIFEADQQQAGKESPMHHRRSNNRLVNISTKRLLAESFGSTQNSSNDDDSDDNNGQSAAAQSSITTNGTSVCSPMAECELCPHNWKVLIEKEDERIKGEYESCVKHGRRRQFECTALFQDSDSSEKIARTQSEYRSCRYTEADEQYRMLRMQIICLLVGVWAMRNVQRQKVVTASLFDQRRMRNQNGSSGKTVKYAPLPLQRKDSIDTHEMVPLTRGPGKVPKSPAPDPNMDMETVI